MKKSILTVVLSLSVMATFAYPVRGTRAVYSPMLNTYRCVVARDISCLDIDQLNNQPPVTYHVVTYYPDGGVATDGIYHDVIVTPDPAGDLYTLVP